MIGSFVNDVYNIWKFFLKKLAVRERFTPNMKKSFTNDSDSVDWIVRERLLGSLKNLLGEK